jgi:hypothetical protein
MLKKSALEFGRALAQLRALELSCELCRHQLPGAIFDDTGFLGQQTVQILGNLKRVCILSDLDDVNADIDRFAAFLPDGSRLKT